jgi:aurora kinase
MKMFEKVGMRKKLDPNNKKAEGPQLDFQKIKINQFKLGKKLGSGRFGNVYIAEEKETRFVYAIKVMNKAKIKEAEMEEQIVQEIKLQMFMNHPNVLKLYGFFNDSKNIYLILEYCNKCLFR